MADGPNEYEQVEPTTFADTYGIRFEQHVVWLLLNKASTFKTLHPVLDETLYTRDEVRRIIKCMRDYLLVYKAIPKTENLLADLRGRMKRTKPRSTAREQLQKTITFTKKLATIKNIDAQQEHFIRDKISEFVLHRNMHGALMDGAESWSLGKYEDIVKGVQRAYDESLRMQIQDLGLCYGRVKERLKGYETKTKNVVRCPVGIPLIDSVIRGGLEPGTLTIMMAPTGVGKTMSMVHLGVQSLLLGLSVVHITLEISATTTAQRYDARLTSVPINEIAMNPRGHRMKLIRAARRLRGSLYIKQWGSSEATTYDIRSYLNTLNAAKQVKPHLLLVDYADLLRGAHAQKLDAKRFDLATITRELRQIAEDYQCAVVTASQTGRSSFNSKVLRLNDVWECLEKVQVADVVLGICQTDNEKRRNLMRIAILKNRLGGNEGRIVDCRCVPETHLIAENKAQTVMTVAHRSTRGESV